MAMHTGYPLRSAALWADRLLPALGNKKAGPEGPAFLLMVRGGVLLSHEASLAVPSALEGLTSGFGMGPGVSPSLWPPQLYGDVRAVVWPCLGNRTVDA